MSSSQTPTDIFADLEATLDEVAKSNPRLAKDGADDSSDTKDADLRVLLEASMAVNSSLVLDDVLDLVMRRAIDFMQAERGLIMLLDEKSELQLRAAFNLADEEIKQDSFKISRSIARDVASNGKSVYTSDAQQDDRYAQQESIIELHLRSIMCVPIKVKDKVIGVIYLDNSSQARMFLKSDLYLFELFAQMVANALHNANLYESQIRLQRYSESVVEHSPVGIVVLDSDAHLLTINPKGLEIFDLNRSDVTTALGTGSATNFYTVLPTGERKRWENMIETALETGEEFSDPRFYHNTRYLEKVLSLRISPMAELPYGGSGVVMAVEDITEKVTMEQYVILSEKLVARGEMAASVAHELNNYLSIITNNAELLGVNIDREKYEKAKFNSKSITENVFKIKRFVDSLMDFSKPEPSYITYDLKHLIDDLLFSLRVQPRFKLIHFTIDLPDNLPTVEIDVGQVQQILLNLLNNAADAIEERAEQRESPSKFKRKISIQAIYDSTEDSVFISVGDNGSGMNEETLGKLFTLHFTTKKGGHGLGLYNCRAIAEQHHGDLTVDSTEGEGTTFTLSLPRFQPINPDLED